LNSNKLFKDAVKETDVTQVYYEEDFKFMTTINEDEQEEEDDLLSRMSERSEQVLNRSGFLDRKVRV
jgi:hypothetical protein